MLPLGDENLDWESLVRQVAQAHDYGRPGEVDAVTREPLLLGLAAFEQVGVLPRDRIEHAAVVPREALTLMAGLTVVTQQALAAVRGDDYHRDVDTHDRPDLWRDAFVAG